MIQELEKRKVERKAKVQAYLNEMTAKGGGITGFKQMGRFEQQLKDDEAQRPWRSSGRRRRSPRPSRTSSRSVARWPRPPRRRRPSRSTRRTGRREVKKERAMKEELNQEEIGNTLFLQRTRAEKKQ